LSSVGKRFQSFSNWSSRGSLGSIMMASEVVVSKGLDAGSAMVEGECVYACFPVTISGVELVTHVHEYRFFAYDPD
jgi:hypothetical protein